MTLSSFHKLLALTLVLWGSSLCSSVAAHQDLQGNYTITRIKSDSHKNVNLNASRYTFEISYQGNTTHGASIYLFGVTIGNIIGGTMTVNKANATIRETSSWSTRMYPGPRLYKIELALLDVIGEANQLEHKNNNTLVVRGSGGTLTLRRQRRRKPPKNGHAAVAAMPKNEGNKRGMALRRGSN
jgi:heat shock protein HslJ